MRNRITQKIFTQSWPVRANVSWGDVIVLLAILVAIAIGIRIATFSPQVIEGSEISLEPSALPRYALFSFSRMAIAFALSLGVALVYGYIAATYRLGEKILLPLLDILQSVPLLSFLPLALLSLNAFLPSRVAAEFASIILIFTCQVWNLILTWYQSLTTIPRELREAAVAFRFDRRLTLKKLQLPFAVNGLVWNSMVSWAGGWFFLMASESFTLGERDFRLPGVGSYLHEAANQGNISALIRGTCTLVLIIIAMDRLVWAPLVIWAERFKVESTGSDEERASWIYRTLSTSRVAKWLLRVTIEKITILFERVVLQSARKARHVVRRSSAKGVFRVVLLTVAGCLLIYGAYSIVSLVIAVSFHQWREIVVALGATFIRVVTAISLALLWTLPVGVMIGSSRKLARWLQPVVQIAASVPSTALFPVLLMFLFGLPGGLNVAAVLLMMMGAQWYLLFNIIAGADAIPQDLRATSMLLKMDRKERWRSLFLPGVFPYVVTGGITASGGAWNTSVVAEYVHFNGRVESTSGIGALIADATARGDYPALLATTLAMIFSVVIINRLFWRRLYNLAEERYRME